MHTF